MSLRRYLTSPVIVASAFLVAISSGCTVLGSNDRRPTYTHTESDFNIGFALRSSYGAAAVIFENPDGTLETYTRVWKPGYLYQKVMKRLSLESSEHIARSYQRDGEYWADFPRQAARAALRAVGFPSSYEVDVLLQAIQQLNSQLEIDFGITISEAIFICSHLRALYQDDLEDAAVNSGVEYVALK